jgi:hypothetical protein
VATRADYESALRATGDLPGGASLKDRPDLIAAVQAHWHAVGNNGCRFAMHLSERRERFGWETWVIGDRGGLAGTADAIATRTRQRLPPVEVDILSFVLPHIATSQALGDVVRSLGQREDWKLHEKADLSDDDAELLCLSVRVELGHWSEILGFGHGAPLAYTRRAPFTELAIRAKAPPRMARRDHRAYMADVPLDADTRTFGEWWKETERRRAERLGDEHNARGKARVTTVVERPRGA